MGKFRIYRGKRRKSKNLFGQALAVGKPLHGPSTSQGSPNGDAARQAAKRKPLQRWQKVLLLSIAVPAIATAIGETLATVGETEANRVFHPALQPSGLSPTPAHGRNFSGSRPRRGKPEGGGVLYTPLRMIFALPIDPSGNMTWAFAQGLALSGQQRTYIYQLDTAGEYQQLYDYLYGLGGYLISADTTFLVQNSTPYPVAIESIQAVPLVCQAPLTGTLLEAPEHVGAEPNSQLGAEVSPGSDSVVMSAPGPDVRTWQRDPFSIPVIISPNDTYTFNIRAVALDVACSFKYEITEVVNGSTVTQSLSNDVFRISALAPAYRPPTSRASSSTYPGYQYLYQGGTADPQHAGHIVQLYPAN
jgi:hypothetical protein